MISSPIMLDFSDVFTLQDKTLKTKDLSLEHWSPTLSNHDTILSKLNSATHRRDKILKERTSKASNEIMVAINQAKSSQELKELETKKLAAEIAQKLKDALIRAEMKKNIKVLKGSKMSKNIVTQVRNQEKLMNILTHEKNEKRHKEAQARLEYYKKKNALQGTKMSQNKLEDLKKKKNIMISIAREINEIKQKDALIRSEKIKNDISIKCALMNIPKQSEIKQKNELLIKKMIKNQRKRHQQANEKATSVKRLKSLLGSIMCGDQSTKDTIKLKEIKDIEEMKLKQKIKHEAAFKRMEGIKNKIKNKIAIKEKNNKIMKMKIKLNQMETIHEEGFIRNNSKKNKVITLRKDTNEGSHVISIVAINDENDHAEQIASHLLSS